MGVFLLVEDEAQVRRLVTRILERAGHRVFTAADADRALEIWPEIAEIVDVVVSDVVMPGPSGPEMVRRLRDDRPELPVLYISAYREEDGRYAQDSGDRFLAKPFSPGELQEVVESLLERRDS